MVAPIADRDYFYDGPLASLNEPQYTDVTYLISPIASADFTDVFGMVTADADPVFNDEQLTTLRGQINTAQSRGIGARYWDTPYYPIRKRDHIWRMLLREGVSLLNADDLDSVTSFF
jgi:hypothetical protein